MKKTRYQSKRRKPVRQFILLVDTYRRFSRCRNTQGRYRVGAKDAKQAKDLLRKAIGFGSILVYYEETGSCMADRLAKQGECLKEICQPGQSLFRTVPASRYDAPIAHRPEAALRRGVSLL